MNMKRVMISRSRRNIYWR